MIDLHSYPAAKIALSVPIVPNLGNNPILGSHFSHAGVGGYVEVPTVQDLYNIPSIAAEDSSINPDGLTSGRRKLGMLVYVLEENKFYQLKPKYKGSKKIISWAVLSSIPDILRGFLLNPSAFKYIFTGIVWADLESSLLSNPEITAEDISSLKEYAFYGDILDQSSIQDDIFVGTGDPDLGVFVYGNVPEPSDSWSEVPIGSGGGASEIFEDDITVSISSGKTFGKYVSGETIPSKDKSPKEVILMACFEALPPVLSISSASILEFGYSGLFAVDLNCSFTINSLNSTVSNVKIERRKGLSGNWLEIFNQQSISSIFLAQDSFNHVRFDVDSIFYKLTVTDSAGGVNQETYEFKPNQYIQPNILAPAVGSLQRYKGDSITNYTGNIVKRSNLVPIVSYKFQRKIDSGNWTDLTSYDVTGDPSSVSVSSPETEPDNSSVKNANSIAYRIVAFDEYTQYISSQTELGTLTINFLHKCGVLYSSSATINVSAIDSAAGMVLQDTKARTITGVSANGMYTYYVYKSSAGNLTNIVQDDALSVLSTWVKQSTIESSNINGATVSYAVYRSSVPGAYTNKKLAFT
jgi:hypothetical protein